jgi:thymidylate kinase
MAKAMLRQKDLRPDLHLLLVARNETIAARQRVKNERDRNISDFFRNEYYAAIHDLHRSFSVKQVEVIESDGESDATASQIMKVLEKRGLKRVGG